MKLARRLCLVVAVLLWAYVAVPRVQAADTGYDALVPADTLVYVGVKDYPALKGKIKGGRLHALYQEPEVQRFLEKAIAKMTEKINAMSAQSGITWQEVEALFAGEVGMGLSVAGKGEGEVLLVANIGNNQQAMAALVAKVKALNKDPAVKISEVEMHGVKVEKVLVPKKGGAGKDMGVDEAENPQQEQPAKYDVTAFVTVGKTFLLSGGTDVKLMDYALASLKGAQAGPALAANPTYQSVLKQIQAESDVKAFLNVEAGTALLVKAAAAQPGPVPVPMVLQAFGVSAMKGIGMGFAPRGDEFHLRCFMLMPGDNRSIFKAMVAPQGTQLMPPAWVPANCASYSAIYFDIPTFYKELMGGINQVSPEAGAMVNMQIQALAADPEKPLKIEDQLIKPFGTPIYAYIPSLGNAATGENVNAVLVWTMRDGQAFEQGINTVFARVPMLPIQTEQFEGKTIKSIALPMPGGPMAGVSLNMAFSKDAWVLATNPSILKGYLKNAAQPGPGLASNKDFQQAVTRLPQGLSMLGYKDNRATLANLYAAMKANPQIFETTFGQQSQWTKIFGEQVFEVEKLPSLGTLVKYAGLQISGVQWTADGALMVSIGYQPK